MIRTDTGNNPRGAVVTLANRASEPTHERVVHEALGKRLAEVLGMDFLGEFDSGADYGRPLYFVPSGTIVGIERARELGLSDEADLFGGVVAQPFVETKSITHPLVRPDAHAPLGWSREFGQQVHDSVLPGYTAFSLDNAREAGRRLLHEGPLRVKSVRATAGRGQLRVDSVHALDQALEALDTQEIADFGLVLEANLDKVATFSVGQVRVAGTLLSYYGTQRLTHDNTGETVYGGSDLVLVEGDFDQLLRLKLDDCTRLAVKQARVYDAAASACFRHFFASRRNYDIAQGIDGRGRVCSGVLEQSWRIGGASSAEIFALAALREGGCGPVIRASSLELYGEGQAQPAGAQLLYQGHDESVGYIGKYVTVEDYGDAM